MRRSDYFFGGRVARAEFLSHLFALRLLSSLSMLQRRRFTVALPFVLLVVSQPSLAFGWGGAGHQIVALIAEDHLSPQAKSGVKELLGDAHISDAEVASWADQVRRERSNTGPWHYVNIPHDADSFDRARDGHDGNNVVDAIEKQAKIVADKSATREERAEALKFVVHFVGDIHQPLHCADRNGDKGGNARLVFYPGARRAVNLHSVWDTSLLRDAMNGQRVLDYAGALDKRITESQRKEWTKGTPEDWANESHRAAVDHAYAGVPADGVPPTITREYIEANEKVVNEQLEKAGVRLAETLNRCFADR